MPPPIHLPGVPHAFADYKSVVGFLKASPSYVQHQWQYLNANYSGALREAGYKYQPIGPTPKPPAAVKPSFSTAVSAFTPKMTPATPPVKKAAPLPPVAKVAPPKPIAVRPRPVAALPPVKNLARPQQELRKYGFLGASARAKAREAAAAKRAAAFVNARVPLAQPVNRAVPSIRVAEKITQARGPHTLGLTHLPGGHAIAQGLGQVGSAFIYAPAGLYAAARHPIRAAEALPGQLYQQITHPGENLGNLALLGLAGAGAIGGTAARLGAASRAAEEAGAAGAARALVTRPTPRPLAIHTGKLAVPLVPFENPAARAVQTGTVKVLERAAAKSPEGFAARRVIPRVAARNLAEIGRIEESIAKGPAVALIAAGKRLSTPQQFALRMVAEQAKGAGDRPITIAQRHDFHAAHGDQVQAKLTDAASRYLVDTPNGPRIRPEFPALQRLYDQAAKVSNDRGQLLELLGKMLPERLQGRISGPGKVIEGAKHEEGLGLVGSDFRGGEARIPYAKATPLGKTRVALTQLGRGGTVIGYGPRNPPSLTKEFTGALMRAGGGRQEATRLVGESNLEAQRLARIIRYRDQIRNAAVPHPPDRLGDYAAIRLDNQKAAPLTPAVRDLIDRAQTKLEEGFKLTKEEKRALGQEFENVRKSFVLGGHGDIQKLTPDEQAQFQQLYEQGKIGWVNRRLLGGLDKPEPRLDALIGHVPTAAVDALNNAFRFAVLYLKPAYAAPNILGNAALNLVQQGFASPYELTRAVSLGMRVGPDVAARIDTIMGEGFAQALAGHEGIGQKAVQVAANVWSKGVDTPFRRASFLYEARRHGFRTPQQLRSLLEDPKHHDELVAISRRANREIIDYARLNPREREIVRRVILFYPWLKGSSIYAARFVAEHPIRAAVTAQVGVQGEKYARKTLGKIPSFEEGAFGIGGNRLVNPAAAAILATPVQAGRAVGHLGDLLKGGQKFKQETARLGSFASPALQAGIEAQTGIQPSTGRPVATGLLHAFADQFPQVRLYNRLVHPSVSPDRLFPDSPKTAVEQFTVGGLAPRPYHPGALHTMAASEQRAGMSTVQRAQDDGKQNEAGFLAAAKKAGALPKTATALPAPLQEAITLRAQRYTAYAQAGIKRGSPSYQRDAFGSDVAQLVKMGKLPQAEATKALAWAKTASKQQITSVRTQFGLDFFGGSELTAATKSLHDAGLTGFRYR